MSAERHIVRYDNRKLYEPAERRFVTLKDLASTVARGGRVQVLAASSGEDITASILSRALASGKAPSSPSADALTRLLRAGSGAAETVATVVERVGGVEVAASMRRAAQPERIAETLAPVTRRIDNARQEVERIVASLVGRGRLTWEEGTRLKDDVGGVFRESLADVLPRVKSLLSRIQKDASQELALEIADLSRRLGHLEEAAATTFRPDTPPRTNRTNRANRPKREPREKTTPKRAASAANRRKP